MFFERPPARLLPTFGRVGREAGSQKPFPCLFVIPLKKGLQISLSYYWIPASAGMTEKR